MPSADETPAGAGAVVVDVGHVVVLAICVAVDAANDVKGCLAVLFPGSKKESQ